MDKTIHAGVFLRAKLYSLQLAPRLPVPDPETGRVYLHDPGAKLPPKRDGGVDGDESTFFTTKTKCKGIGRAAAQKLRFDQFCEVIEEVGELRTDVRSIRSFDHHLFKVVQNKRALGSSDDKFYLTCAIHSLPYGDVALKDYDGVHCPLCVNN